MEISNDSRIRATIYVSDATMRRWEAATVLDGSRSKSDFAGRAIDWYAGYIAAQEHTDFFAAVIHQTVTPTVHGTESRLARLQFKSAVETAKLAHLLASLTDVDDEALRQLHIRCIEEVKRINGIVTLDDVVHDRQKQENERTKNKL